MFSKTLIKNAKQLLAACEKQGMMIAAAESCTGGLIAALLTEIPGSSAVVERGFVTYSNAAKQSQLGVAPALIKKHGAVSAEVAGAMAIGAIMHSKAALSIAVTGIAGPSGGTKAKPVGLVYISVAIKKRSVVVREYYFKGTRAAVRNSAVEAALRLATESLAHCA